MSQKSILSLTSNDEFNTNIIAKKVLFLRIVEENKKKMCKIRHML